MRQAHKEKLLSKLHDSISNLYHNATPRYPRCEDDAESKQFEAWFESKVQDDLHDFLHYDDRAKKIKALFGEVYSWGRCGRTLAPKDLVHQRGGRAFSLKDCIEFQDYSKEWLTDAIVALEEFNKAIESWNKAIDSEWQYEKQFRLENARDEYPNENLRDFA